MDETASTSVLAGTSYSRIFPQEFRLKKFHNTKICSSYELDGVPTVENASVETEHQIVVKCIANCIKKNEQISGLLHTKIKRLSSHPDDTQVSPRQKVHLQNTLQYLQESMNELAQSVPEKRQLCAFWHMR